jgi:hypothetical protein
MVEDVIPEALALLGELRASLDKLAAVDLTGLSGDQLLEFTREWEQLKRSGVVIDHAAAGELDARHVAGDQGARDTATLLVELLRIDPSDAWRRLRDAADFGPRHGLAGEPLEPLHPQTAAALVAGEVSIEHARVVANLFDHLPAQTAREAFETIEQAALDIAAMTYPRQLAQWAVRLADRLDADGPEPDDREPARRRRLTVIDRPDGTAKLSGELSPYAAAALRAVLGPLSAPAPAEDGTRDQRNAGQRRHDGLLAACERLLCSGTLPPSHGATTTILVTIDYHDLLQRYWNQASGPRAGTGYGSTSYGQLLPVDELLRRAGEAEVIPVVLADTGAIMAYGRGRRLATPDHRRALAARDRGCGRPGCTVPADWCEAHHVVGWAEGGSTDLGNLALVCGHDHDLVDHGATITMINGVPYWTDPRWLDPSQALRRNTAQHVPYAFPEVRRPPDTG